MLSHSAGELACIQQQQNQRSLLHTLCLTLLTYALCGLAIPQNLVQNILHLKTALENNRLFIFFKLIQK